MLILTAAAEAQARSGHDILTMGTWYATGHADDLEPVDDVIKSLVAQNGKVTAVAEYLGTVDGRWIAVPAILGTQTKPPCGALTCSRNSSVWISPRCIRSGDPLILS